MVPGFGPCHFGDSTVLCLLGSCNYLLTSSYSLSALHPRDSATSGLLLTLLYSLLSGCLLSSVTLCVSYSKSPKDPLTCPVNHLPSVGRASLTCIFRPVAKLWPDCPGSQMPILVHYLWLQWQRNETQSLAITGSPPGRGFGYEKHSEISQNWAKHLAKTSFFLSRKLFVSLLYL